MLKILHIKPVRIQLNLEVLDIKLLNKNDLAFVWNYRSGRNGSVRFGGQSGHEPPQFPLLSHYINNYPPSRHKNPPSRHKGGCEPCQAAQRDNLDINYLFILTLKLHCT